MKTETAGFLFSKSGCFSEIRQISFQTKTRGVVLGGNSAAFLCSEQTVKRERPKNAEQVKTRTRIRGAFDSESASRGLCSFRHFSAFLSPEEFTPSKAEQRLNRVNTLDAKTPEKHQTHLEVT